VISTIAGTGTTGYSGDNGQATAATVYGPSGIAIDSSENIYFNDYSNCRVRKIAVSTSIITTYAGTGSASYSGDGGVASSASMKYMWGLCMDTSGNTANNRYISLYTPCY
jgi:sugar lactone lactonase YvrE